MFKNVLKLAAKGQALMWVYTLVVAGFLVGAGVIALDAFQGATTADSAAYNAIGAFITALGNFATQAGTIGTMVGIGMLIAVVFGALAYFAIDYMTK